MPARVPVRVFARTDKPITRAAIMFAGATAVAACGGVVQSGIESSSSNASSAARSGGGVSSSESQASSSESSESSESASSFPILYGPAAIPDANFFEDVPIIASFDAGYGVFIDGGEGDPADAGSIEVPDGAVQPPYGLPSMK
jgi:hypothetical protein